MKLLFQIAVVLLVGCSLNVHITWDADSKPVAIPLPAESPVEIKPAVRYQSQYVYLDGRGMALAQKHGWEILRVEPGPEDCGPTSRVLIRRKVNQ